MKLAAKDTISAASSRLENASASTKPVVTSLKRPGIVIETNDSSFTLSDGENLLDALLNSGHAIAYQCRAGYCGSCRTKVHHGTVDYDEVPLAHLNADEILPCCCRVSESLKLAANLQRLDNENQGLLFE